MPTHTQRGKKKPASVNNKRNAPLKNTHEYKNGISPQQTPTLPPTHKPPANLQENSVFIQDRLPEKHHASAVKQIDGSFSNKISGHHNNSQR